MENLVLEPLHEHWEYLEECSLLLNEEWPMNKELRMDRLKRSSPDFPFHLLLLSNDQERGILKGHSRLSRIPNRNETCLVLSIVVWKAERGKGLGRILMKLTDQYAAKLGFKSSYLTTHDKQAFYKNCGYQTCEPIVTSSGSSSLLSGPAMRIFMNAANAESSKPCEKANDSSAACATVSSGPAPPPPPPLPPSINSETNNCNNSCNSGAISHFLKVL